MTRPSVRPRTACPDCGRDVAFVTDLQHKWLARHTRPTDGRWCPVRRVAVAPLGEP